MSFFFPYVLLSVGPIVWLTLFPLVSSSHSFLLEVVSFDNVRHYGNFEYWRLALFSGVFFGNGIFSLPFLEKGELMIAFSYRSVRCPVADLAATR